MKKIFKNKKIIIVVILLFLFSMFWWIKSISAKPTDSPINTTKVVKTDLQIAFSVDGKLTIDSFQSNFLTNGKVAQVLVKEGDTVYKGQTIARLDMQELSINLRQAENTLRDKQAIAEKIEDEIKDNDTDETFAQKALRTTAQAARDSAYDEVLSAKRAFQDATITSPINGVVAQLNLKEGQSVNTQNQDSSVIFIKPDSMLFIAYAEEDDVLKISDEQSLKITLDAYNKEQFPSKLIYLSPISTTDSNGLSSYKIIAGIENPNNLRLLDGMEGSVYFITKEVKDVIAVANKAVYREGNQSYVDIKESNGDFKKTPVETGFTDGKNVEVVSGLLVGQEVLIRN
jgi:RND family efflux transporter MFP subunit